VVIRAFIVIRGMLTVFVIVMLLSVLGSLLIWTLGISGIAGALRLIFTRLGLSWVLCVIRTHIGSIILVLTILSVLFLRAIRNGNGWIWIKLLNGKNILWSLS